MIVKVLYLGDDFAAISALTSFFALNANQGKLKLLIYTVQLKVIPQKLNLPMNFVENFPESSLLSTVSKKEIKMIGHHSRLRDMMGQSYPIYACTVAYHAHYL